MKTGEELLLNVLFGKLQKETYSTAKDHGFQNYESNQLYVPTKLGLIGTEVSEALEAHRIGKDDEIGYELADIVIRTMDLAESLKIDLAQKILNKSKINAKRVHLHGGKRY